MALDVGNKRIGVAVADPSETFALPIATIVRANKRADLDAIKRYLDTYDVDELVVGEPLTLAGERGIAALAMEAFVDGLREIFAGTIHRVDERLTTAQATKTLAEADVFGRRRRKVVDRVAAALILETYLARRRNSPR